MGASLKIVRAHPPNIDLIDAAFHVKARRGIVFAYGDSIYNPTGNDLPKAIIAHEEVHCIRQSNNPDLWWNFYIADVEWRLHEEILAHRAEWRAHCADPALSRNNRRWILKQVSAKLANPLYGRMINGDRARVVIQAKDYPEQLIR